MFVLLCLCYLISGITNSNAYPSRDYRQPRSYPHQAMMFSGFYGHPNFSPQSSMSAFATRDAVASNTFASGNEYPYYGQAEEEDEEDSAKPQFKPELTEETSDRATAEEDLEVSTAVAPKREPSRRVKPTAAPKPPRAHRDEEEDDDSGNWPLDNGRRGYPGYNAFFPIVFGSRGASSRSGEYEGGMPGSATAIANSFSTGKGGVASSHATAYGDPYLSMLLRSGGVPKNRNLHKNSKQ